MKGGEAERGACVCATWLGGVSRHLRLPLRHPADTPQLVLRRGSPDYDTSNVILRKKKKKKPRQFIFPQCLPWWFGIYETRLPKVIASLFFWRNCLINLPFSRQPNLSKCQVRGFENMCAILAGRSVFYEAGVDPRRCGGKSGKVWQWWIYSSGPFVTGRLVCAFWKLPLTWSGLAVTVFKDYLSTRVERRCEFTALALHAICHRIGNICAFFFLWDAQDEV